SVVAREAGIRYPVALTRAVWQRCVAVPPGVLCQDEAGRLWDLAWMLACAKTGQGRARRYPGATAEALRERLCPGASVQTTNFYLQAIKQFARWLVRDRRMGESPLAHLQGESASGHRAAPGWQRRWPAGPPSAARRGRWAGGRWHQSPRR